VPAAVILARVVRDLTQEELGTSAGISQGFLSKVERGDVDLDGDRLLRVAAALKFPVEFFLQEPGSTASQTACAFPRKRNSLQISVEKRVRALLQITRLQVEPLLDDDAPPVTLERRSAEDADWISPVEMAAEVRARAGLPSGPIPNLTQLLEKLGVLVVVRDLGSRRLDALGQWPNGHRPLVLVNSTAPADRRRFTSSHELGHAVLHTTATDAQEREADQFAAALLMPPEDGRKVLRDIDIPTLERLKAQWGMSMAALIRRARDLGLVNDYRYRQLNIELSKAGRSNERVQLTPESPATLLDALARQRAAGSSSIAELAARARMTVTEFENLYLEAAS